jgi:putative endonuclease
MFYVYIIYSERFDVYYKGITEDPARRLSEHNEDKSRYTAGKGHWEIVYLNNFTDKRDALIEERRIKSLNRRSLEKLISGN